MRLIASYADLPYDVRQRNYYRLHKQICQFPAYFLGRRKGIELALTLEADEIEFMATEYRMAVEESDEEYMGKSSVVGDKIIGPHIQTERDRICREYAEDQYASSDVYKAYMTQFEAGMVAALREAYSEIWKY